MSRSKKKLTKDKYERQKEQAKERQRKRRAKLTDEQLEAKRAYDRDRYKTLKDNNEIKSISQMTPREQRKKRKSWKKANQNRRDKLQAINQMLLNTPPSSPVGEREESRQKVRGRKMLKANRAKVYRTLKKQNETISKLQTSVERYKKRYYREIKNKMTTTSPSPRKQVKEIVGREKVSPRIQKRLFLGLVLEKQIQTSVKANAKSKKKNQLHRKVLGNKIIKKYRVQKYFKTILPYKVNKVLSEDNNAEKYTRKSRETCMSKHTKKITQFFECDTVSRMCPGKKDYITKGKKKMQRRVLLDTIENLHKRFVSENKINISLRTFYRMRPYWVTFPRKCDRDTCACVRHTNMELLTIALKQNGMITEKNLTEIVKSTVCSSENEKCMYEQCEDCESKSIRFTNCDEGSFKVKYRQWEKVKEKRVIKNKTVFVNKTVKVRKILDKERVVSLFKKELTLFKKHVYRAYHQSKQLKEKIASLTENEVLFRIDFSENYICKSAKEVQSAHFGASKKQISLHTGIFYYKKKQIISKSFASISDNLDHQAHAIWAHMHPILLKAAYICPNATVIHFYTDSPSNQYRNKTNIYLFKTRVSKYFKNLSKMTWNYTEAGHGKGPMDGVGGSLKREADRKVAYGADITNAAEFVQTMNGGAISLYEVPPKTILKFQKDISLVKVPLITGIMQAYQITFSSGVMTARRLSCFQCPASQHCEHYFLFEVFPDQMDLDYLEVCGTSKQADAKSQRKKAIWNSLFEEVTDTSSSDDEAVLASRLPASKEKGKKQLDVPVQGNKTFYWKDLTPGKFVLVEFPSDNRQIKYIYLCTIQKVDEEDGEISVQGLKLFSKNAREFVIEENDKSAVTFESIKELVEEPQLVVINRQIVYKFTRPLNVFEKGV